MGRGGGGGYREMSSDGGLALRLELLLHSLFSQEIKPVTSDELNCVRPLFFRENNTIGHSCQWKRQKITGRK